MEFHDDNLHCFPSVKIWSCSPSERRGWSDMSSSLCVNSSLFKVKDTDGWMWPCYVLTLKTLCRKHIRTHLFSVITHIWLIVMIGHKWVTLRNTPVKTLTVGKLAIHTRFDVFTVLLPRIRVILDVMLCFLCNGSQLLKESWCLYLQGLSDPGRMLFGSLGPWRYSHHSPLQGLRPHCKTASYPRRHEASWLTTFDCCLAVSSLWVQDWCNRSHRKCELTIMQLCHL